MGCILFFSLRVHAGRSNVAICYVPDVFHVDMAIGQEFTRWMRTFKLYAESFWAVVKYRL